MQPENVDEVNIRGVDIEISYRARPARLRILCGPLPRRLGDPTSWGAPPVTETVGEYWFHTASVGIEWRKMITLTVDGFNPFDDQTQTDIDRYLPELNYLVGVGFNYRF